MIICNSKAEFMSALDSELTKYGIMDKSEIFSDFEQHFTAGIEQGLTEQQVCEKLGDISEIAKQYVDEETAERIEAAQARAEAMKQHTAPQNSTDNVGNSQGFEGNSYASQPEQPEPSAEKPFQADAGAVVGIVCVDVFVFTWALPAFVSIVIAYLSIPLSLAVSGISTIIGGIFAAFGTAFLVASPFAPVSTILLGVMTAALGGLAAMLGIVIVKGTINVFINIINWHGRVLSGHNVIHKKFGKKNKEAAQ